MVKSQAHSKKSWHSSRKASRSSQAKEDIAMESQVQDICEGMSRGIRSEVSGSVTVSRAVEYDRD